MDQNRRKKDRIGLLAAIHLAIEAQNELWNRLGDIEELTGKTYSNLDSLIPTYAADNPTFPLEELDEFLEQLLSF